ncbi:hypothetical protein V8E53_007096 [Lactarius tabidus]
MHLFRILPILSLLFGAHASSLDPRRPDAHPLDARDLSDVCGSLNTELVVPDLLGILTAVGVIDVCLCQSALPLFLDTNVVGILGVTIAGDQVVTQILTEFIIEAAANENCNYPDHSSPACVDGNPCGFDCLDGYTPSPAANPTTCACATPNMVCNGHCVPAGSCPSSQATPQKRWIGSGSCTEKGHGWAACGVFGEGARAWECVNTARDLESCGGCVLPLTPFTPIGQDCTALPGVADVSCLSGGCVVHRCMSGYALSRDGTSCISIRAQTINYGLEHRPLQWD